MGICTVSSTSFRRKEPSQYWLMYFFPFSFSPGDLLDCFQKASMLTFKPICQEENSAFWSCYKRERVSGGAGAARSCVDHQPPQHAKEEIPSLQVFSLCLQFLLQYFPLLLVCVCTIDRESIPLARRRKWASGRCSMMPKCTSPSNGEAKTVEKTDHSFYSFIYW